VHPRGLGRLQQELLKPFSPKDEPGYIYMFWLTDSPLSPFSTPVPSGPSTPSDHLLRAAANAASTPGGSRPKLLFKIGRAVNVQRRLHQWTAQCGYNLALIRYYPHTSASSPGVGKEVARTVPNVNRVERLIHLELGATPGARPKKQCEVCGKTHQEWFEVEASKEGILAVDEVIKRWIAYAERSVGTNAQPQQTVLPIGPSAPGRKNAAQPAQTGSGGVKMYKTKPADDPAKSPKKSTAAAAAAGSNSLQVPKPKQQRSSSASAASRNSSASRQRSTSRQRSRSTSRQPSSTSGRRKGRRRNDEDEYSDEGSGSEDDD
jgi:hypothetical protein